MPDQIVESLSMAEFADLQRRMRNLPEGSLLFVEAEFSPRQRALILKNTQVTLITATDGGGITPPFHCICLKVDYDLALKTVRDVVANRGGTKIVLRTLT